MQWPTEVGINQYGSMFQHVANPQRDEDNTPPLHDARHKRSPPRVSHVCQPSPMDKDIERHEDPDVQGRELVPFNLQGMDLAANQPVRPPPSPHATSKSNAHVDEGIAVVTAPVEARIVINVSDIESYGTKPHLLGDSSDSDDDDEGVSYGVEISFAPEPRPMEDAPSGASTGAGLVSAPVEDDFYNAAGKALHPDSIIPKQESGWWAAREERKRKKA